MSRTRTDWEEYCIEYIKNKGMVFDIWWATENKFIANAMDRLVLSKRIKVTPLSFPLSEVIIKEN